MNEKTFVHDEPLEQTKVSLKTGKQKETFFVSGATNEDVRAVIERAFGEDGVRPEKKPRRKTLPAKTWGDDNVPTKPSRELVNA